MRDMRDRHMQNDGDARRRIFLVVGVLLAVDLAFIAGFALHRLIGWPGAWWVAVHQEWTPPEMFQYGKEAAIVLVAVALWRAQRSGAYLWTAALFVALLLDDSLAFHERGGEHLAAALGLHDQWRLRAVDFGELMVAGLIVAVLLPWMIVAHRRAEDRARRFLWRLYAGLAALALTGIVGDMVNIMLLGSELFYAMALLEDGGEMLVMSLLVGLMLWHRCHSPAASLSSPAALPIEAIAHEPIPFATDTPAARESA